MLVIVRNEGSLVYGGKNLTLDLEQTFDHVIRVERVVDDVNDSFADISVRRSDGSTEFIRFNLFDDKEHEIDGVLTIALIGFIRRRDGDRRSKPAVRIGFAAPRSYKIVRDNAIKKVR